MHEIRQTIFGPGKGNCASACVASIMELPLESLPNFGDVPEGKHQFEMVTEFIESQGWQTFHLQSGDLRADGNGIFNPSTFFYPNQFLCILSGRSPRGQGMFHAVVGKASGYRLEFVWDPHPSDQFLVGPITAIRWLIPPRENHDQ